MSICEVPGASINYEVFGRGHDVVWIAGGGGLGSDWHKYQMPYFEEHFRNITFDNRGIGATTCDEPMPWPLAKFSADTISLIEQVCEPPVSLVAISFGSAIAQQVAIDRPDLVRSARDGDRFAKRVVGLGLPKGRDRSAQGGWSPRRYVRLVPLRRNAVPRESARRS